MRITDSNNYYQRLIKPCLQWVAYPYGSQASVFIFGAQRSGTTLLSGLYNELFPCRVFGEFSQLSSQDIDKKIRLNPLTSVKATLERVHAPVTVIKPLVESQHAETILKTIPNSHGIWMYRHYREVTSSDIKQFPSTAGHGNLKPILSQEPGNWRSENMSRQTLLNIERVYRDDLSQKEAACLFWYARNRLFFEQIWTEGKMNLLNYHALLASPEAMFNTLIESQLSRIEPIRSRLPIKLKTTVDKAINRNSGKDRDDISPEIAALCDELWQALKNSPWNIQC